jgi:hypothetical protein
MKPAKKKAESISGKDKFFLLLLNSKVFRKKRFTSLQVWCPQVFNITT